jgi:predicted nuclease with RNAse H fold
VKTSLIHTDEEPLERIAYCNPAVIAIDVPFNFPEKGTLRRAEKEMISKGCRVLRPTLSEMSKLTI